MNKILAGLLVVAIGVVVWLGVTNIKLREKVAQLHETNNKLEAELKDAAAQRGNPANPANASPFDKPNTDPFADKFNPSSTSPTPLPTTSIKFDKSEHDFGRIKAGTKVRTTFKFTNTGDKGLVIYNAQSTCGCTVPEWPREPVKPGESAEIKVEFDSEGKHGEVTKMVSISANTEPAINTLTIKSTVIPIDK